MSVEKSEMLLTIGIPVFNGEKFISDTIKSINVPNSIAHVVEIIVCDNCSSDNTAVIVNNFSNIKYYKNSENIGYDRNIHNVFLKATGKFVWTIAADDLLLYNDCVSEVLDIINKEKNIALIHVGGKPQLEEKYQLCTNAEFLIASDFRSGGVSSNIINRNIWLNNKPSDFFDSEWIHFGVVIKIASKLTAIVTKRQLIDENPLAIKLHKTWDTNGKSLVVMLKLIKIFKMMDKFGYPQSVQQLAISTIKNGYPKEIIKNKAKGLVVTKKLLSDFIYCYKSFPSFWLLDLPALLAPQWMCQYIYNGRKGTQ